MAQSVKNLPTMQETWVQFLGGEDSLEKGMATHISILAWEVPWIEEPGGLQSMGLQRFRHNWVTNMFNKSTGFPGGSDSKESACNAGDTRVRKIPWRREWLSTWVFLPGEFHGQKSLVGYIPWGHKRVGHNWLTNTHTHSIKTTLVTCHQSPLHNSMQWSAPSSPLTRPIGCLFLCTYIYIYIYILAASSLSCATWDL